MIEEWKDIAGYDGVYQVSNCGRIRSFKKWHNSNMRILKPAIAKKGYLMVSLSFKGKVKHCNIHRLVAEAFLDNPNHYDQINHINENKTDNNVDNLEWCSSSYNMTYGTRAIRHSIKISKPVICLETGVVYDSSAKASRLNPPIRQGNITLCCQHKNKSAGGFHWEYYPIS